MKMFIIGIVGLLLVSILNLFVPSFYSYSWGYADVVGLKGVEEYSQSTKVYYSLSDAWGAGAYLVFGLVIFILVYFAITLVVKKSNTIGFLPLIYAGALIPIGAIILCAIQTKEVGRYIKVGNMVVGAGVNAGVTGWFIISIVLLSFFYLNLEQFSKYDILSTFS